LGIRSTSGGETVRRRFLEVSAILAILVFSLGSATATATASSTSEVVTHLSVTYRVVGGTTLSLDVYAPRRGGPYPAVLVVHGGGWHGGDKSEFRPEGENLALAGFVAFVANYRLAPPGGDWHAPAAIQDLHAAVRWIRRNAATYHADPAHVGALGSSAGGNLAQMIGVTGRPEAGRADVVVSWSGSTRLQLCTLGSDPVRTCASRTSYVGSDMDVDPAAWDAASPYSFAGPGDPPMYLANSTAEIVAEEEATDMAARLAGAGVVYQLHIVQGDLHARGYEDQVWDESVAFLRAYLVPAAGAHRRHS
jgi:acetyl esterase/lipase